MGIAKKVFVDRNSDEVMVSVPALGRFTTNDNFACAMSADQATSMFQLILGRRQAEYYADVCEKGNCNQPNCDGGCYALKALRSMNQQGTIPDVYIRNWLIPIATFLIASFVEGNIL